MKKSIYFLMTIAAALFTSCEPMDDIYSEVDATLDGQQNAGTVSYTLTDEDFATDTEDGGLGFDRTYFISVKEANDSLPTFLDGKYPQLGGGSIANITMEIAEPLSFPLTQNQYVAVEADYLEQDQTFGNFDSESQLYFLLDREFPNAENGTVVDLTYEWYNGTTNTVTNSFLWIDDSWTQVMVFDSEDYQAIGEARANIDNRTEAMQKLPVYLSQLYPFAMEGDTKNLVFKVHIGGGNTDTFLKTFTYDGDQWQGSFIQTLQFGHNGVAWEPDNTIIHTLAPEDYSYIGGVFDEKGGKYTDPGWALQNHGNFDRRLGNRNYADDAMLLEAMNILLNDKVAPGAPEGQKYLMVFAIYNGANGTEQLAVIKQGDAWVLQ